MEHISSRQNPLVKQIRELARGRGAEGDVLLEGPHLVDEACRSGVPLTVAIFSSEAAARQLDGLLQSTASAGARIVTASPALLASMSPVQHPSGVLAVARLGPRPLEATLVPSPALVLVLDGVQDPGNVGAIIRTAEACGATGVILGPGSANPFGWKALRGAMGSTFRLPIASVSSVAATVAWMRAQQVTLFATVPRGGTPLPQVHFDGPAAILVGGEGAGLGHDWMSEADARITIEMRPPVESLNVAVSTAIILYEASRQRSHVTLR